MTRFDDSTSPEYDALRDRLEAYAEDSRGPSEDVRRLTADALGDHLRGLFTNYWGLEEPADGPACIRRVITGEDACDCRPTDYWQDRELARDEDPPTPPHQPPFSENATLWLDDGRPVLYSMHVSWLEFERVPRAAAPDGNPRRNGWFDVVAFAEEWGLEIGVTPFSWYDPLSTVNVVFYAPEWSRGGADR